MFKENRHSFPFVLNRVADTYSCFCASVPPLQDELLAELDELEQEELDKNLLEIGGTDNVPLPNVPSTSLPSRPGRSSTVRFASKVVDTGM